MKKIVKPGSGVDDMGGGIVESGCRWFIIVAIVVFVIGLSLRLFKVI